MISILKTERSRDAGLVSLVFRIIFFIAKGVSTLSVKVIWQERGQRMADEAILRDIPRPSGAYAPSGSGPKGGKRNNMVNFSALEYATKLELEARQYLGWHHEYYKGGFYTSAGKDFYLRNMRILAPNSLPTTQVRHRLPGRCLTD